MGGQALKNTFTRRYNKDEFDLLTPIVKEKLEKYFKKVYLIQGHRNKETYGDADFLVLIDDNELNINTILNDEFFTKEIFKNGNIYSFEYKEFQIDLILTTQSKWETSINYFNWSDLGNLIGKVAHKFGLKWGFEGLVYVYRTDGKVLGNINVSKDYREVLTFLGFDSDRYDLGFKNLDEIFDYVTSSKYFNPWMFDFETLNRINRERDQKRTTYANFVKHVTPMKEIGQDAYFYFYPNKSVYLGHIDFNFPGFLKEYNELEIIENRRLKVKSIFNGKLVMEAYPNLKGQALGNALHKFENAFASKYEFEESILTINNTKSVILQFKLINGL
jgi:hypothetical protein